MEPQVQLHRQRAQRYEEGSVRDSGAAGNGLEGKGSPMAPETAVSQSLPVDMKPFHDKPKDLTCAVEMAETAQVQEHWSVAPRSDYCVQGQRPVAEQVSILAKAGVLHPSANQVALENTLMKHWEELEESEPACSCKAPIAQKTATAAAAAVVSGVHPTAVED